MKTAVAGVLIGLFAGTLSAILLTVAALRWLSGSQTPLFGWEGVEE